MRALLGWLAAAAVAAPNVPKPDPNVSQPGAELNPEALEAFVFAHTAVGAAQLVARPGTYTVPARTSASAPKIFSMRLSD